MVLSNPARNGTGGKPAVWRWADRKGQKCLHGRSVGLGYQLVLQPDELPQLGVLFKPVRQACGQQAQVTLRLMQSRGAEPPRKTASISSLTTLPPQADRAQTSEAKVKSPTIQCLLLVKWNNLLVTSSLIRLFLRQGETTAPLMFSLSFGEKKVSKNPVKMSILSFLSLSKEETK